MAKKGRAERIAQVLGLLGLLIYALTQALPNILALVDSRQMVAWAIFWGGFGISIHDFCHANFKLGGYKGIVAL